MKYVAGFLIAALVVTLLFYVSGRVSARSTDISVEQVAEFGGAQQPGELVVAAYNIAHGRGSVLGESNWSGTTEEKHERLQAIGHFLDLYDVDIVVLNEVDFNAAWSGNQDQASVIADAGGFSFIARQKNYHLTLPGFTLSFGNAILSRFPLENAERVELPPMSWFEPLFIGNHDAIKSDVIVEDKRIELWGLHLEVRDRDTRLLSAEFISGEIDTSQPYILLGDLNSQPASMLPGLSESPETPASTAVEALNTLNGIGVFPSIPEPQSTFPTEDPRKSLDWIFYRRLDLVHGRVDAIELSDHLPVIAHFRIQKNLDLE